jgi:hypothetical protein
LPDPGEPNDDVALVKPGALFRDGTAALTTASRAKVSLRARVDATEDPEDVYRAWIPAGKTLTLTLRSNSNVDLEAWKPSTQSIGERGARAKRDLAAKSQEKGKKGDAVKVRNANKRGAFFYADVFLGRGVGNASYTLTASTGSK